MPRTAVTPTALVANSSIARPAGTTIDATLVSNGVEIAAAPTEEIIVEVTQTDAAAKTVTIRKGAAPPAHDAGQGDLTASLAQNAVRLFGPFTSGRFAQADGKINVDFETGTTGTLRVYRCPRTA
jgi:hypothetical protein